MKKLLLILTCVTHQLHAQTELTLVKDINPGEPNSTPGLFAHVNDQLFFIANNGTNGIELWKTDGTPGGFEMIEDIKPGYVGSIPEELVILNNQLFFTATDNIAGNELSSVTSAAVSIFPNPFKDETQLVLNPELQTTGCEIRIYDLLGKRISSLIIKPNDSLTFGKNLSPGFYIAEILLGSKSYPIKIVKL